RILAPSHDAIGGAGEFALFQPGDEPLSDWIARPGDDLSHRLFLQFPDPSGVEVAVNVFALQLRQTLAVIDEAASDRAKIRVRVFNNRLEDRRRPFLTLGPEIVRAFH